MGRKLQTIYEYLSDYQESDIDAVIDKLETEDKLIIRSRYGDDLHNPTPRKSWNKKIASKYYNIIIPHMRKMLNEQEQEKDESLVIVEAAKEIEGENINSQLTPLIKSGKTNKEIYKNLQISSDTLYRELLDLKNKGLRYSRKYYSDGSIKYKKITTMQELKQSQERTKSRTIITDVNENNLKLLLISDLHFGNNLERLDLLDRAYNYCIKNGINIILCGGDFLDGAYTRGTQKITDLYHQVEYFIENYPQDESILTFGVAGDHDISIFNNTFQDMIEMCNNYRHDIIIGGYNNAQIDIKNDKIHMYHHIEAGGLLPTNAPIILHGHSHKYSTNIKDNQLNITIPTISNINQPLPSALEMNLYFNKGYVVSTVLKQIAFQDQDLIVSENSFPILKSHPTDDKEIRNVEPYKPSPKRLQKALKKPLSQVEKFNLRYGLSK